MKNKPFRDAYKAAAEELETLLIDQERIEERILTLRKTMNALASTMSQHEGKDKDFTEYAYATWQQIFDGTLTDDIYKIVSSASHPLTAAQIRGELKELGTDLAEHSNPLATIYAILNRLRESGKVKETLTEGKKAWERYKSLSEKLKPVMGRLSDLK